MMLWCAFLLMRVMHVEAFEVTGFVVVGEDYPNYDPNLATGDYGCQGMASLDGLGVACGIPYSDVDSSNEGLLHIIRISGISPWTLDIIVTEVKFGAAKSGYKCGFSAAGFKKRGTLYQLASGCIDFDFGADGSEEGAVYAIRIDGATGDPFSYDRLDRDNVDAGSGINGNDKFGYAVVKIPDVNGDGWDDLLIGAPEAHSDEGKFFVYYLDSVGNFVGTDSVEMRSYPTENPLPEADRDGVGYGLGWIGDLDANGYQDYAYYHDADSSDTGAVVLMFMGANLVVINSAIITATNNAPQFSTAGPELGMAILGEGEDLDLDGVPDIILGHRTLNTRGGVHVLYMNPDGSVKGSDLIFAGATTGFPSSAIPAAEVEFGRSLIYYRHDVNNPERWVLMVGMPLYDSERGGFVSMHLASWARLKMLVQPASTAVALSGLPVSPHLRLYGPNNNDLYKSGVFASATLSWELFRITTGVVASGSQPCCNSVGEATVGGIVPPSAGNYYVRFTFDGVTEATSQFTVTEPPCSSPPTVSNSDNSHTSCSAAHLSTCTLTCSGGYTKTANFVCQAGGVWTSPSCQPSPCSGQPAQVTNGQAPSCSGLPLNHGSTCPLTCNSGFDKSSDYTCSLGSWDSPSCTPSPCLSSPPPVTDSTNAHLSCTAVSGNICVLECSGGFTKSGDFLCTQGNWNVQTCSAGDCLSNPPAVEQGTFGCSPPTASGNTCLLTCAGGFTKSGNALCTTGSWSMETCSANACASSPGPVVNSDNTHTSACAGTSSGGSCPITCSGGYTPSGNFACYAGGWSTVTCDPGQCVNPPSVVSNSDGTETSRCVNVNSGSTCALQCASGYAPSGTFLCTNAAWSAPTCNGNPCTDPLPAITNSDGSHVGCTTSHGSSCPITCNEPYTATGAFVCSAGAWGPAPSCSTSACTTTPPTEVNSDNSHTSCGDPVPVGDGGVCNVNCDDGYYLSGTLTCSSAAWSAVSCQPCTALTNCDVTVTCETSGASECSLCKAGWWGTQCTTSCGTASNCAVQGACASSLQRTCTTCANGYSGSGTTSCAKMNNYCNPPTSTATVDCGGSPVYQLGDSCTFSCGPTQYLSGGAAAVCGLGGASVGSGVWSTIPTCEACTPITNCYLAPECTSSSNSVCPLCEVGYWETGTGSCGFPCPLAENCANQGACTSASVRACVACADGYTGDPCTLDPSYCSVGPTVPFSSSPTCAGRSLGDSCSYTCLSTHYLDPPSGTSTCELGRAWSSPPVCRACNSVVNCAGTVECGSASDQTCTACISGSWLSADRRSCTTCGAAANCDLAGDCLSSSERGCETCSAGYEKFPSTGTGSCSKTVNFCPAVPTPTIGSVTCDGRRLGDGCTFACTATSYLIGPSSITCAESGAWSTECPGVSCPRCTSCTPVPNCVSEVTCTTSADSNCAQCAIGFYPAGGDCLYCGSVENCEIAAACESASQPTCTRCFAGFVSSGPTICEELPPVLVVPTVPAFTLNATGPYSISVTWNASDGRGLSVINYTITVHTSEGDIEQVVQSYEPRTIIVTVPHVAQQYSVVMTAANLAGYSDTSPEQRVTSLALPPLAPALSAASATDTTITVVCGEAAARGSAVTGYIVEAAPESAPTDVVSFNFATHGTHVVTSLLPGTSYTLSVVATSSVGPSVAATVVYSTLDVPGSIGALSFTLTLVDGAYDVKVEWNEPSANGAAITSYTVEVALPGAPAAAAAPIVTLVSSLNFTAPPGALVAVSVVASNAVGASVPVSDQTITPVLIGTMSARGVSARTFTVFWETIAVLSPEAEPLSFAVLVTPSNGVAPMSTTVEAGDPMEATFQFDSNYEAAVVTVDALNAGGRGEPGSLIVAVPAGANGVVLVNSDEAGGGGASSGAIAAIVILILLLCATAVGAAIFIKYREVTKKKKKKQRFGDGSHGVTVKLDDGEMEGTALLIHEMIEATSSEVIGSGGAGDVLKAKYEDNSWVALKVLRDQGEESVREFHNEVNILSILAAKEHPNIIQILCFCEEPPAVVLELAEKGSMHDLLKFDHPTAKEIKKLGIDLQLEESKRDVLHQCSKAMEFLHDENIVHLDLKPRNWLVSADGLMKLTDFGVSVTGVTGLSPVTAFSGTPQYASPERFRKGKLIDLKKCDVYSFGIIIWQVYAIAAKIYKDMNADAVVQMLQGQTTFDSLTSTNDTKAFQARSRIQDQIRQHFPCDKDWPTDIKRLVEKTTDYDAGTRPHFTNMTFVFKRLPQDGDTTVELTRQLTVPQDDATVRMTNWGEPDTTGRVGSVGLETPESNKGSVDGKREDTAVGSHGSAKNNRTSVDSKENESAVLVTPPPKKKRGHRALPQKPPTVPSEPARPPPAAPSAKAPSKPPPSKPPPSKPPPSKPPPSQPPPSQPPPSKPPPSKPPPKAPTEASAASLEAGEDPFDDYTAAMMQLIPKIKGEDVAGVEACVPALVDAAQRVADLTGDAALPEDISTVETCVAGLEDGSNWDDLTKSVLALAGAIKRLK